MFRANGVSGDITDALEYWFFFPTLPSKILGGSVVLPFV
jgi:hypothetical protein